LKKAVSVSLGSSRRDKKDVVTLLGEQVEIERRGTDGDIEMATALFTELDGQVDALGVGGIDLWVQFDQRRYPLHAAQNMVRNVTRTPVVDGSGLKNTLEKRVVLDMAETLKALAPNKHVLLTAALDRYGMTEAFFDSGFELVCADLMFALGIPIPIRTQGNLRLLGRLLLPLVGRLPISVLYPTGDKQDQIVPKFERFYQWADIIAGDLHYIKRHMPDDLGGKIILTNTTTLEDLEAFKARGVKKVITTTRQLDGRSFGTNMMEAALTAASGLQRELTVEEIGDLLDEVEMQPTVIDLTSEQLS